MTLLLLLPAVTFGVMAFVVVSVGGGQPLWLVGALATAAIAVLWTLLVRPAVGRPWVPRRRARTRR